MKNMYRILSLTIFILTVCVVGLMAQNAPKIPFQGVLYENGDPVTATKSMTFSIVGTNWTETQDVAVVNGLYSVSLGGENNPFPEDLFATPGPTELLVSVGGVDIATVELHAPFISPEIVKMNIPDVIEKEFTVDAVENTTLQVRATGTAVAQNAAIEAVAETTNRNTAVEAFAISGDGNTERQTGVYGQAQGSGSADHRGIVGVASGGSGKYNKGILGFAEGTGNGDTGQGFGEGSINFGVEGNATGNAWNNTGVEGTNFGEAGAWNFGVHGISNAGTGTDVENHGVAGRAYGPGINYGVFGDAGDGEENWAGYFNGDVKINGSLDVADGFAGTVTADQVESVNEAGEVRLYAGLASSNSSGVVALKDAQDNNAAVLFARDVADGQGNTGNQGELTLRNTSLVGHEARLTPSALSNQGQDEEINSWIGFNWLDGGDESENRGAIFLWGDVASRENLNGQDIRRVSLRVADDGNGGDMGRLTLRGAFEGDNRLVELGGFNDGEGYQSGSITLRDSNGKEFNIDANGIEQNQEFLRVQDPDGQDVYSVNFVGTNQDSGTTTPPFAGESFHWGGGTPNIQMGAPVWETDNDGATRGFITLYGATPDDGGGWYRGFAHLNVAKENGNEFGVLNLEGQNSPNFNIGAHGYDGDGGADRAYFEMFGSIQDQDDQGNPFFANRISLDVAAHGPNTEVGEIRVSSSDGAEFGINAYGFTGAISNLDIAKYGNINNGINSNWNMNQLDFGGGIEDDGQGNYNTIGGGASIGRRHWEGSYLGYLHVNGQDENGGSRNVAALEARENEGKDWGQLNLRGFIQMDDGQGGVYNPDLVSLDVWGVGEMTETGAIVLRSTDGSEFSINAHGINGDLNASNFEDIGPDSEIYGIRGEAGGIGADNFSSKYSGVLGVGNGEIGDNAGVRGEVHIPSGNQNGGFSKGVQGTINSDEPNAVGYGVRGDLNGSFSFASAVRGIAGNTNGNGDPFQSNNIGGFFSANNNPEINVGVVGNTFGDENATSRNIGVSGESNNSNSIENIGVFGTAANATGDNWAGFFLGNTKVTGDLYLDGEFNSSNAMRTLDGAALGVFDTSAPSPITPDTPTLNGDWTTLITGNWLNSGGANYASNGLITLFGTRDQSGDEGRVAAISAVGASNSDLFGYMELNGSNAQRNFEFGAKDWEPNGNNYPYLRMVGTGPDMMWMEVGQDTNTGQEWGAVNFTDNNGNNAGMDGTGSMFASQNLQVGNYFGGSGVWVDNGSVNLSSTMNISNNDTPGDEYNVVNAFRENNYGIIDLYAASNQVTVSLQGGSGDIIISGTLNQSSDERLKKDIKTLDNSLENVQKLRGVSYTWKDENKTQDKQIGLIAQEIEKVYPEFVHTNENGMKSVNYAQLTAVLIEAVKELSAKVTTLESKNSDLKASLDRLEELESKMNLLEKLLLNKPVDDSKKTASK